MAAINNKGSLASFSAYGAKSVDISAPGLGILSSVPAIAATPSMPAAALSSVGTSGGKALTVGFGADEIGDATKRASFFTKAFSAVERESQPVVLVDDDQSDGGGLPDVGATLSSALRSATGSALQEIDVPYDADGPTLSQLHGKTVVWATGEAWDSEVDTTFTAADQLTLIDFLNDAGKLVITGMDALYEIEGSAFVTNTLGLRVTSDKDSTIFSGASGTAFAGESYTFDSDTAWTAYHDWVVPAGTAALTQGSYEGTLAIPATWESWDGTSMATPHVTGTAAARV